jgi:hypothetical protein
MASFGAAFWLLPASAAVTRFTPVELTPSPDLYLEFSIHGKS